MFRETISLISKTDEFFEKSGFGRVSIPDSKCIFSSYVNTSGKKIRHDSSVDFVGSNTNMPTIKDRILNNTIPPTGLYTNSPKLRTWNTNSWQNPESRIGYSSAFNSFGLTFGRESTIADIHDLIIIYLSNIFGINKDEIVITGDNEDLLTQFQNKGSKTLSIKNSNRFNWKFGVKNPDNSERLTGVGVAFEIQKKDELSGDMGTLELIYDNGTLAAIEFGMGFETSLSRLKSDHPIIHTQAWDIINNQIQPEQTQTNLKTADAFGVAIAVLRSYSYLQNPKVNSHKKGKEILTATSNTLKQNYNTFGLVNISDFLGQFRKEIPDHILKAYLDRF